MRDLALIDHDPSFNRTYIPLPGGWEVQTKGKGSTFRLCDKHGDRLAIPDSPYLHETLEKMGRDIHAEAMKLVVAHDALRRAVDEIATECRESKQLELDAAVLGARLHNLL